VFGSLVGPELDEILVGALVGSLVRLDVGDLVFDVGEPVFGALVGPSV
jgi:hypothetical protein